MVRTKWYKIVLRAIASEVLVPKCDENNLARQDATLVTVQGRGCGACVLQHESARGDRRMARAYLVVRARSLAALRSRRPPVAQ